MNTNQRKPIKRAFSGLVGLPPEPETIPAPAGPNETLSVDIAPKRRGRPPKGERAMTSAERKAQSRERKARSQIDQERRGLIAQYLRMVRKGYVAKEGRTQWIRQLRDSLLAVSIEKLRNAVSVLKKNGDSKGHLASESSGHPGISGMSGVECIDAAIQRDQKFGGRKVTPFGAPIDSDDDDDDKEETQIIKQDRPIDLNALRNERKLAKLTRKFFTEQVLEHINTEFASAEYEPDPAVTAALIAENDPDAAIPVIELEPSAEEPEEPAPLSCKMCDFTTWTWDEAKEHLRKQLEEIRRLKEYIYDLAKVGASYDLVEDAQRRLQENKHYGIS